MFARFFIDRPIFAWVISIVIVMGGLAAALVLPIAQYPEITPPTVQVTCQYPGANAEVVAQTVAAPIEQQVNGVEGMLYMSSQCTNDGSYNLTVTFELGTDLNMAQVLVQNRVSLAMPTLPDVVKATGVSVKKKSPAILLAVNLYSEDDPATGKPYYDQLYLSNYATIQVRDELARLDGVGDVNYLGQQDYSMRIWVDPDKMASRDVTAGDVVNVLREQNVQVAAGQVGQPPVPPGQDFQYNMRTLGRLEEAEQFADIVLKTGAAGEVTRLRDVARIELGARNQDTRCRLDGRPSAGLAVYQLPGSNALETADRVKAKMKELERRFPRGLKQTIVYDTTPFIHESVNEVFKTLRDAVILVAIVVLLFLQDWKSLILPLIDVGVSLVGTFAVMMALGFTLNNLTLFGLVLAIGIVVDDAIVVLENIERWIGLGYRVREATIRAMDEITGPIIAITLVLSSVFLPSAFLGGITGQFYRQFALTIAASMVISAVNAMTMTPARAGSVFKDKKPGEELLAHEALPPLGIAVIFGAAAVWLLGGRLPGLLGLDTTLDQGGSGWLATRGIQAGLFLTAAVAGWVVAKPVNKTLGTFFRGFNWVFNELTRSYGWFVGRTMRLSFIVLVIYGGLIGLTYLQFTRVPMGFIPSQDKGYLLVNVQLPDSASLDRSIEVMQKLEQIARETPGVAHTIGVPGQSIVLSAISSNYGSMFIILKPFDERKDHSESADAIANQIRVRCRQEILEGLVAVFGAPPVDGLGNAGGFKLMVEKREDVPLAMLQGQADTLAEQANRTPGLVGVMNSFRASTPQLYLDIDRTKAKTLGVPLSDVFQALQVFMGGYYVNDFNRFDRTWQVNVQAEPEFRVNAEALRQFYVRNAAGEMVPLGTVLKVRDDIGPVMITRYNTYPAATINGSSLPGVSSGAVIRLMEDLSGAVLPPSMTSEWTELTLMQKLAGSAAAYAFAGAVILVFLVLAAQYESWSLPLAVILVVPMCLLCALTGVALTGWDINIFVQVGFVVLVGLASKNAILVVEFAKEEQKRGKTVYQAALEAAKVRLRPIIMTSFAFILGVVPLVSAHGAGAEMRQTLGIAVFSGMLGVTAFGLILTPVFYYLVRKYLAHAPAASPASASSLPADV